MVASARFAEFLSEQLAPLGRLSMRRMFGKTGIFCDGVMLGIVSDDQLYVRIDDDNRDQLAEARAAPPLAYEKGGKSIDLAFWRVPDRLLDDPEGLLVWARAGLDAARRVAARAPKPRRSSAAMAHRIGTMRRRH